MKTVILAGGLGTRLAEETDVKPKPMVEIGGQPILWHIMKHYARYGFNEFVVALGYKGEVIKRYFLDYHPLGGSLTVDLANGAGQPPMTASARTGSCTWSTPAQTTHDRRPRQAAAPRRSDGEPFMLTYGDGVSRRRPAAACWTSTGRTASWRRSPPCARPPLRRAGLRRRRRGRSFTEKPQIGEGWINGGFFVFEPAVFDYLDGDATSPGGATPWRRWRPRASSRPTGTTASGSAWTRCATCGCCESLWQRGRRRGRSGNERRVHEVLAGPAHLRHRRHRAGGRLAGAAPGRRRRRRRLPGARLGAAVRAGPQPA